MQLKPMRLFTPAKINTILRILSKREDGFHEIFTHMVPISFFDELTLQEHSMKHFSFRCNLRELEGPENLVWKALKLLKKPQGGQCASSFIYKKHSSRRSWWWQQQLQLHCSPLTDGTMNLLLKKNFKNLGTNWVLIFHFYESRPTLATGRGNILRSLQNYPLGEILLVIPLLAYPQ